MFGFSFFHRPKPRQFNYRPLHYDPAAEEREKRRAELRAERGEDADAADDKGYVPGDMIRSRGFASNRTNRRRDTKAQVMTIRLVIFLVLVIGLAIWALN